MATSKLTTTNLFDDGTTIKYSVSPYEPDSMAVTNAKASIMTFNEEVADTMTDCIVANSGATFKRISAATIETTEKTLIYAKDEVAALKALNGEDEGNGEG